MNKTAINLILCMVLFGATAAQGASLSSLWHKHGSTALWSLYALGAVAATYACHKDVPMQIERLKMPVLLNQDSFARKQHNEALQAYNSSLARCYAKPVELAVFFALMGGAVKFYDMYFK